jgi:hypothetical protein
MEYILHLIVHSKVVKDVGKIVEYANAVCYQKLVFRGAGKSTDSLTVCKGSRQIRLAILN